MAEEKTKGTADQVKGRAREAVGDLTDNDDQRAKGKAEQAEGKAKETVGTVKDKAKDLTDRD